MSKFLILWELDTTKLPEKPEQALSLYIEQLNMIKEDFKKDTKLDWGLFAGSNSGYSVSEGTEQEIDFGLLKYSPYVKFRVFPVLSVDQVLENVKKLSHA
jgi:hypothetical protein